MNSVKDSERKEHYKDSYNFLTESLRNCSWNGGSMVDIKGHSHMFSNINEEHVIGQRRKNHCCFK